MANTIQDSARLIVIDLITRDKELKQSDIRLLQNSLKELTGPDGKAFFNDKDRGVSAELTGKAVGAFLDQPENHGLIPLVTPQVKDLIKVYGDFQEKTALQNLGPIDKLVHGKMGFDKTPETIYEKLFDPKHHYDRISRSRTLDGVLQQPNNLDGDDIKLMQVGLKLSPNGIFGRNTASHLVDHLAKHPQDWAVIGAPVLRMLENTNDAEVVKKMAALPKPDAYYERVHDLMKEAGYIYAVKQDKQGNSFVQTDFTNVTNFSGTIYELQLMLTAGGYYRNQNGSVYTPMEMAGGIGSETLDASTTFYNQYIKKFGKWASLEAPDDGTRLAENGSGDSLPPSAPKTDIDADSALKVAAVTPPSTFKPFS
jgi:hypothetical protein